MSDIEIVKVDPLDQNLVDQWLEVLEAAQEADLPDLPHVSYPSAIVGLLRHTRASRTDHWVARRDGRVVAAGEVQFSLRDNRHLAEVEVCVAPEHRRQGIGGTLLEHLERCAVAEGRRTLVAYTVDQLVADRPRSHAGQRLSESAGYTRGLDEIHRIADLTAVDDTALDGLLADAWGHADGYEQVQWVGAQPDEIVAGSAYLNGRMNLDAPMGDLEYEQDDFDADRIRESEAISRAKGTLRLGTVVRHVGSGEIAGYTEVMVVAGDEEHCWQGNTIVDPRHRGKRIGTILKIANHRLLQRYRPLMRYVHTWNAEVNAHMIGINEAVGYRAVDRWIAYQKKLTA